MSTSSNPESPADPLHADPAAGTGIDKVVYFRRELPPLSEAVEGEHIVEADSPRLPTHFGHDELWSRCADALQAEAIRRIEQEVHRQGGSCAHVVDEQIEPHSDFGKAESWLRGRYTYVMYRHPRPGEPTQGS